MAVWDVIVLGAGPAGSAAAAWLARSGARVLVLEKATFPRFHIGESLLPASLPRLADLGLDLDRCGFLRKSGAEFLDERMAERVAYPFADALPGTPDHAFQVDRAHFDTLLAERAEALGATLHFGEAAQDPRSDPSGVSVRSNHAEYQARFLLDATGQDALLARSRRTVEPIDALGRAAVFTHADRGDRALDDLLGDQGNIQIVLVDSGWLWVIPLAGGRVSVGLVSRERGISTDSLERSIESSPLLRELFGRTRRDATRIIGNFSFRNRAPYGVRYAAVGDAACFLDPVFSSGVFLALEGAHRVASAVGPALRDGTEDDPAIFAATRDEMTHAYDTIGALVHSFYHTQLVSNLFFAQRPVPELRSGLISVLGGDVWRQDNRFQLMLQRSSRRRVSFTTS